MQLLFFKMQCFDQYANKKNNLSDNLYITVINYMYMYITCWKLHVSGGSRNFRTGGAVRPGAVEFLRPGDCIDAHSHVLYAFFS